MGEKYELSITVPAYEEVESLPNLIELYREAKKDITFQLVIVNNGSTDGTADYLKKVCSKKENKFIKVVTVEKNIGYGYGIHQGLKACDADVIGWSHADLECNPADVFVAYNMFKNAPNTKILVKGHRYGRNWKSLILTHALTVFSAIFLLTIFDDINGQPKVFHKDLFNKFKRPPNGFSYDLYVQYKAKKNKYNVLTFNIFFGERKFGFSKWAGSFFKRLSTIKDWAKDVFKIMLGIFK